MIIFFCQELTKIKTPAEIKDVTDYLTKKEEKWRRFDLPPNPSDEEREEFIRNLKKINEQAQKDEVLGI